MTIREAISQVRKSLKEVTADSRLTNRFIYSRLLSTAKLLIKRESDNLKLSLLVGVHQTWKCVRIEEVPAIDECYGLTSCKRLFRTIDKMPDAYEDTGGPIVRRILSADGTTKLEWGNIDRVRRATKDTNSKYDTTIYAFPREGRIYLTKKIPLQIDAYFINPLDLTSCREGCSPFLDSEWKMPFALGDGVIMKVVSDLINSYKKLPEDTAINKNPNG